MNNKIIDEFHKLYYGKRYDEIWGKTFYKGIPCLKCPLDLWLYQEIFFDYKPEVIIELGTFNGGSAIWLADTIDSLGLHCKIVTVDCNPDYIPYKYSNIEYITSFSTDADLVQNLYSRFFGKRVIAILDSDHSKENVLKELQMYAGLIQSGGYLIVEDTNLNGQPVREDWGAGTLEAVTQFLSENKDFQIDESKHKFLLSFNINGYLKRI